MIKLSGISRSDK